MAKRRKQAEGMEPSPWWNEMAPEIVDRAEQAKQAGAGQLFAHLRKIADMRLEMRAVNERWPVPREARAKLVADAFAMATDPSKSERYRLGAAKLLVAMDAANRTKELPDQMTVHVTNQAVQINVNDLLRNIEDDPRFDSLLDQRSFRPLPGAADDYAE